jgi:pimeloyl-ACP methyl ester carboxylesterase
MSSLPRRRHAPSPPARPSPALRAARRPTRLLPRRRFPRPRSALNMLLTTAAAAALVVYFGLLLLLLFSRRAQNAVIFLNFLAPPAWSGIAPLADLSRHRLAGTGRVVTAASGIRGWHVLPPGPHQPLPPSPGGAPAARDAFFDGTLRRRGAKVVVFFHGNSGTRAFPFKRVDMLRLLGAHLDAHVVAFDYSGFGDSPGRPSEAQLYADSLAVFSWVRERVDDSAEVILYGQSLGTFAAVYLMSALFPATADDAAFHHEAATTLTPYADGGEVVHAVVLDAPPASLVDATLTHPSCRMFSVLPRTRDLATWALFGSALDNVARFARVRAAAVPVLLLHGRGDTFIPVEQGRRVAAAARKAGVDVEMVEFDGIGHVNVNGAEPFLRTLIGFLDRALPSGTGRGTLA